ESEPAVAEGQAAGRERLSGQPQGEDGDRGGAAQSVRGAGAADDGGEIGVAARRHRSDRQPGAGAAGRAVRRALWVALVALALVGVSSAVFRAAAVLDPNGA